MKPPRQLHAYEERHLDCQFALEPLILDMLERAATAGWGKKETINAVASVIINVLCDKENLNADAPLAAARKLH
jgi:hypothetical protein